jgi:hypothetical protein
MHLCPQYLTIIYEFLFPLTLALSLGGEREVLKVELIDKLVDKLIRMLVLLLTVN